MKYTRYNYNRKSIINRVFILLLSIFLIFLAFIIIFNKFNIKGDNTSVDTKEKNIVPCTVQIGCFSKKENAEKIIKEKENLNPFIVESDGKFKIILGIYHKENAQTIISNLKSEGIDVTKEDMLIKESSKNTNLDIEVIDAALKLNDKLTDKEVSSIKTYEFKKWFEEIVSSNNENVSDDIKSYVSEMPDELTATNNIDNMKKLYDVLKLLQ
ncbi:SPOR domain-containing protein [Clostridium sp. BJN0001]|uniref:SPOR domain-containing protein n=1 Tax=Clostridium sp. BJN0001 TaxID=2930219 RepID=UPI001FD23960|nr:SPOR domain-containing protein [Clostridium sp. BJN0001]